MERLVALGAALAFISVCHTSLQKGATVVVDNGRLGIGRITGGTFGSGSFSIGRSGGGRLPQMHVNVNKDDGERAHIIVQIPSHHKGQQDNRPPQRGNAEPDNSGGGNTQLYPVKPQTTHAISVQGGMENGFAKKSGQGSIQIGSITGGNFTEETGTLYNNSQKESTINNGNTGYSNAANEALYSIGHGANHNGASNSGDGYNHDQINSGHKSESGEEPWIWSR